MSDYKHQKVVRLPFPQEILKKCNTDDHWECEGYLSNLLGDLWQNKDRNSFDFNFTSDRIFIDWVYYDTYGEESGDWGNVRMLTEKELEVITPYFNKLGVVYEDKDLRVVDYCYYNACEPPEYYNMVTKENDDSNLFITS